MPQGRPSKPSLLLLAAGVTITELAADIGVSAQAVSQHINAQSRAVPTELLRAMSRRLEPETLEAVLAAVESARQHRAEAST